MGEWAFVVLALGLGAFVLGWAVVAEWRGRRRNEFDHLKQLAATLDGHTVEIGRLQVVSNSSTARLDKLEAILPTGETEQAKRARSGLPMALRGA